MAAKAKGATVAHLRAVNERLACVKVSSAMGGDDAKLKVYVRDKSHVEGDTVEHEEDDPSMVELDPRDVVQKQREEEETRRQNKIDAATGAAAA